MKRFISILAFLALSVAAFGQGSLLKQTLEIVELEINDGEKEISVFDMPEGDVHQYFFCAGTLGIGDDIIQFNIDPVSNLFIPLGGTLEEALAKMEEIRGVANMSSGDGIETVGILAVGNPSTGEEEPVYLTARRFLFQKNVTFTVKRNGYVRSTDLSRSDLGAMVNGIKFYRKIHPNEP